MERSSVGSLLRTNQALCGQLCEKQTFDFGIAYYCERFPRLPEVNQIREVIIADEHGLEAAIAEGTQWFSSRGLECLRWSPALGLDPEPMSRLAGRRGLVRRNLIAMHLAEWCPGDSRPDVRILPARAVREMFRQTFNDFAAAEIEDTQGMPADSFAERLDDPQLDMFVASLDRTAAGRCGLYQVGDIARIVDLFVHPSFAGRGVAEGLLSHALALARRLTMPMVVAQVAETDAPRRQLLNRFGFVEDGRIVEFEAPTPFASLPPI